MSNDGGGTHMERTCYDLHHKHSIEISGLLIVTCLKVANEKPTNDICNEIFHLLSHVDTTCTCKSIHDMTHMTHMRLLT